MILRKLRIENIATYDKAEIDFKNLGYPVFVTGKTGAGKTTLFVDAITAAFFAKAYGIGTRGIYKELIMKGKTRGEIFLEFESENTIYQIRRIFKPSEMKVFLKIIKDGKEYLHSYQKDVEKKISQILGLDYNGLLNSVVVRQGDVYEFIEMQPSKRRDLLIDILRISLEKYKEIASNRLEDIKMEIAEKNKEKEMLEKEIKKEEEIRRRLEELRTQKPEIEKKLEEYKKQKRDIDEDLSTKLGKLGELENKLKEIRKIEEKIKELESDLREIEEKISEIKNKLSKYPIEKIKKIEEYWDKKSKYDLLEQEIKTKETEIRVLEDLLKKKKKLEEITKTIEALTDIEQQLNDKKQKKSELEQWRGGIKSKINEIEEALKKLQIGIAKCPVCGADLTDEKILERKEHLNEEKMKLSQELKDIHEEISILSGAIKELERKVGEKQKLLGEKQSIERDLKGKEVSEAIINKRKELLEDTKNKRKQIEAEILEYTNAKNMAEAKKILEEIRSLKDEIPNLEKYEEKKKNIEEQIEERKKDIAEKEEIEQNWNNLKQEVNKLKLQRSRIESEINNLGKKYGEIIKEIEQKNDELQKIEESKTKIEEIKQLLEKLEIDRRAYEILTKEVFSERGLPAKLLEKYLMVIQDAANDYLSVFGQDITLNLILIKQRGSQSVEIEAYADGFKRPIKTFSGGERTLMGFAIRLAIGKLVSRLYSLKQKPRFLIIDEGFGALDEEKRNMVARALSELYETGEFEQIIVVSHQDDLKNSPVFKTVVEVFKNEQKISKINIL